jgi:hypothetical protein
MAELVIQLEGGLVQWVYKRGSGEITGSVVIDFDTEGSDKDEITSVKGDDGNPTEAVIHDEGFITLEPGSEIDRLIEAYNKKITGRS